MNVIPLNRYLPPEPLSSSKASSLESDATLQNQHSEPELSSRQKQTNQPLLSRFAGEFRVFLSTFITIFLAEIGDKTQVTTLLMSAESRAPWVVFLGAGLALVLTSLLGVIVGRWLSKRVSIKVLETTTACILLVISVLLLWDVVHL